MTNVDDLYNEYKQSLGDFTEAIKEMAWYRVNDESLKEAHHAFLRHDYITLGRIMHSMIDDAIYTSAEVSGG